MFGSRADNFRTNETTGCFFGIQTHMAFVYQHNATATLVSEKFADYKLFGLIRRNLRVFQTDRGQLRIGEHHADYTAAQTTADIRIAPPALSPAIFFMVGSFVQQRG